MLLISVQEFCAPELLIAEKIVLRGSPAGEREPLHVVSHPDVVVGWIIQAGMRGGSGDDRRQRRWKFLRRCPLIEPRVRTAPHRHFTVTEWLLRQPLNHVVAVARFICERFELAAGIASAAHVDEREHITVGREIGGARMVRVRDVRRQRKDDWRLRQRTVWSLWQIQRRVHFDFVAHWNLDAPPQVVVRRWLRGGWRRSW